MFRQILMALKFSPAGLQAFETAVRLARVHEASLHVFHALDYHYKHLDDSDPQLIEVMATVRNRIRSHLDPHLSGMPNVRIQFFPADPALEACRIARDIRADLIVVGCHQPHGSVSMGRVDYIGMTILEKSPCAVMLIPYDDTVGEKSDLRP